MVDITEKQTSWLSSIPIPSVISDTLANLSTKRDALGLKNPGTVENISKEVHKDVLLTDHAFTGLKADITKSFSIAPLFQVSHSFAMGSQMFPPYTLATMFGNSSSFLHANIDNEGSLSGRCHYRWNPALTTRVKMRISPSQGSVCTIENEYTGKDFTAGVSAMNPSLLEGGFTGVIIGNYLQQVTPALSLGLEAVYTRQSRAIGPEAGLSYVGRYATPKWVATGHISAAGSLQATYWRQVAEKVAVGVDTQIVLGGPQAQMNAMMGGPPAKDGTTSIGAKYEFRHSIFKTMVDSNGKLSCLVEKRVAPTVNMTFYGDMDHFKNQSKLGISVSVDMADEELMEQQERQARSGEQPIPPPF